MEAPEGHAVFLMFAGVGQVDENVCSACHPFSITLAIRSKVFVGLLFVCACGHFWVGGQALGEPKTCLCKEITWALLLLRSLASQVSPLPHRALCLENFLRSFLLWWQVVGGIAWNVFAPGFHYLEVS